jgi:hypothetical protein
MNWLTNLFWDIRFKIEDAIYDWKNKSDLTEWDVENSMDLSNEGWDNGSSEEIEVKPKKKKAKKKTKNKK